MLTTRQDFDLLLVIGYFRSALPLLSIVRYLSPQLRVGFYFQPLSSQMDAKTGKAQKMFERLCLEFGGVQYVAGAPARCRLMLVQQYPYTADFVASVRADIEAAEIWGMLTLSSMGLDAHDAFLTQFGVNRLTVPDKGLAEFLLESRNAVSRYQNIEIIEVGLPFKKYPVFEEFSADWIVAAPALFSFHAESSKQKFLSDVLKLMTQIPKSDVVVYKSHNGNARDYFTPKLHSNITSMILWFPGSENLFEGLLKRAPRCMQTHASKVLTAMLHARVLRRAIPMVAMTPMADMSIEAFLTGVRKGIIGGDSNTIWGTLFMGLSYYNCVASDDRKDRKSELLNKIGDKHLEINLKYFGVPYCHGLIERGSIRSNVVLGSNVQMNIVDMVICALIKR